MKEESEKINEKDFIEIQFTGRIKGGDIFDSNVKEELQKTNFTNEFLEQRAKPFIFCIGYGMFLKSIDEFLIGKEIRKEYEVELEPEKAFGKRNPHLIKVISINAFSQQKYSPQPGMVFNFDNQLGKVISVSGGRVTIDFNNPLAGKTLVYKIKVLRKLNELNEKIKALMDFLFKKEFPYEIKEKDNKLIIKLDDKDKQFKQFIELFKDKFKEILEVGLVVEVDLEKIEEHKKNADDKQKIKKSKN